MTERGYTLKYYSKNGEELFSYSNDICAINVINESEYIDIILRYGKNFPYDHEHRISEVVSYEIDNEIKMLAPIQIIDYFSTIVSQNIEIIEGFYH